jgi:hypothetical protein
MITSLTTGAIAPHMAESENTPPHPHEITLELIFRQSQRILGDLGQIREKQDKIIVRLSRVEREVVDLRRDIVGLHEDYVGLASRLDHLDRRVERIERRLDLVAAPACGKDC